MLYVKEFEGISEPISRDITYTVVESVEDVAPVRATMTLDKDELNNVIEFIEFNFIESIRIDTEIDNIDYIISMMSALQKFRAAYASIELKSESE